MFLSLNKWSSMFDENSSFSLICNFIMHILSSLNKQDKQHINEVRNDYGINVQLKCVFPINKKTYLFVMIIVLINN